METETQCECYGCGKLIDTMDDYILNYDLCLAVCSVACETILEKDENEDITYITVLEYQLKQIQKWRTGDDYDCYKDYLIKEIQKLKIFLPSR